jgi:hypothetical protein
MPAFKRRTKAEKRAMARKKLERQVKNKEGLRRLYREARASVHSDWLHTSLTRIDMAAVEKVIRLVRRMDRTRKMLRHPADNECMALRTQGGAMTNDERLVRMEPAGLAALLRWEMEEHGMTIEEAAAGYEIELERAQALLAEHPEARI